MDRKMETGNRIMKNAYFFSVFFTFLLVVGGFACILVGALHQELVVSQYTNRVTKESAPLVGLTISGICMWIIGIPLVWYVFKPMMDGYGIIVCSAANKLKKDGVETYLDNGQLNNDNQKQITVQFVNDNKSETTKCLLWR